MDNQVPQCITLNFDIAAGMFEVAGEASSKIKSVLQQIGVAPEAIRRIAIAVYEAEINVIIHSLGGAIAIDIYSDRAEVCVKDQGPGIPDVELALQEGYSTAADHIRQMGFGAGMGLPNIKRCSDDFHIASKVGEGTTLDFVIRY